MKSGPLAVGGRSGPSLITRTGNHAAPSFSIVFFSEVSRKFLRKKHYKSFGKLNYTISFLWKNGIVSEEEIRAESPLFENRQQGGPVLRKDRKVYDVGAL